VSTAATPSRSDLQKVGVSRENDAFLGEGAAFSPLTNSEHVRERSFPAPR